MKRKRFIVIHRRGMENVFAPSLAQAVSKAFIPGGIREALAVFAPGVVAGPPEPASGPYTACVGTLVAPGGKKA
jgi:hypothetical protein